MVKTHRGKRSTYARIKRWSKFAPRLQLYSSYKFTPPICMATVQSLPSQLLIAARSVRLQIPQDEASRGPEVCLGANSSCSEFISSIDIMLMNSRSIKTNSAELAARTDHTKATIIAVCESWLDASIGEITIPGYEIISRRDRAKKKHGGLCSMPLNCFQCCQIDFPIHLPAKNGKGSFLTIFGPIH